jgi:hypothetical protein
MVIINEKKNNKQITIRGSRSRDQSVNEVKSRRSWEDGSGQPET